MEHNSIMPIALTKEQRLYAMQLKLQAIARYAVYSRLYELKLRGVLCTQ